VVHRAIVTRREASPVGNRKEGRGERGEGASVGFARSPFRKIIIITLEINGYPG